MLFKLAVADLILSTVIVFLALIIFPEKYNSSQLSILSSAKLGDSIDSLFT